MLTWVLGCAPPDAVRIVEGTELVDVPRGSLSDLDAVRGDRLEFFVETDVLEFDPAAPLPRDGGLDAALFLEHPDEPVARWMRSGGVAVATDFDTLALFTAHVSLERILDGYAAMGVRDEVVAPLAVHYAPSGIGAGNASYHTGADAMLVLRPASFEDLPLSMNPGVLAHELGHRVTYWELWDGRYFATLGSVAGTVPQAAAYLHLMGLGEGTADYRGAVLSDDPAFVTRSFGFVDRDLTEPKVYDADWLDAYDFATADPAVDPHDEGAIVAAALWATGEDVGHELVLDAVLEAERALVAQVSVLDYDVGDFEREVVRRVGPAACPHFLAAFAPIADTFAEECP